MAMRADARALHARLWERRERQAFRRGFDRSLLNAWAGAGYQSYFLRDRSGGHRVSPVGDSGPAGLLEPRSEMQGSSWLVVCPRLRGTAKGFRCLRLTTELPPNLGGNKIDPL